jgi:hypothetical protein
MISEQDFEHLSAYVDNALSPAEKAALEARLQREPELKAALRDLRLQTLALRDLPRLKPPRNFTLSVQQAQAIRPPPHPSFFASLFPALRLATAVSAFAFVAVLAASFVNANQGSLALAPAAEPAVVEVTQVAEAEQAFGAAAVTPEMGALTAPAEKQSAVPEATESIAAARIATDTVTADAATPVAESGLAQSETALPEPTPTGEQVFLPSVASAPEQPASAPPLSPFALGAVALGVITLVLALATWLARRG